jgi:hypothetical protein
MLGEQNDLSNVLRYVRDGAMHCGQCRHRLAANRDGRHQLVGAKLC